MFNFLKKLFLRRSVKNQKPISIMESRKLKKKNKLNHRPINAVVNAEIKHS